MASFDPDDPRFRSDAAFQQWLLDSAKSDDPPPGATEGAWLRFAKMAGAALPVDAPQPGGEGAAAAGGTSALKWLTIGALGGTLVTATWMGGLSRNDAPSEQSASSSARAVDSEPASRTPSFAPTIADGGASSRAAVDPAMSGARARAAAPEAGTGEGHGIAPSRSAVTRPRRTRRAPAAPLGRGSRPAPSSTADSAAPAPAREEWQPPRSASSTLEREVALLDAVRDALTDADFARALELVSEYRQQFAREELARDADVFEIEAYAGLGNSARATSAARTFLHRYPRDPHASRLRAFAEAQHE